MDFQNTPGSVNTGESVSIERFGKVFSVPGEKYAYNSNVICDNDGSKFPDAVDNVNSNVQSDYDSTFHCESSSDRSEHTDQEQNYPPKQQSNDKLDLNGVFEHSENITTSKEWNPSLSDGGEVTESDSRDNFELSNDINDTKESAPSVSERCKITKSDSRDNLELSNDRNDSKSKLSDDFPTDDQSETAITEDIDNIVSKDTRRTRRSSKRKRDSEECCPVCGITVRLPELEGHFVKEVENLSKIPKNLKKTRTEEKSISMTYVQVKSNRENRLSAKVSRYAARDKNEVQCPVCSLKMRGTQTEINKHVLSCINEDEISDELVVVDDDEDSFEEYEFADQTRVRAISLVPGGYKSLQGNFSKSKPTDEDEDLNVDVDDTFAYGKPQYTEMDVIHTTTDATEVKELEQLRKAVLFDPSVQPHILESRKWTNTGEGENKSSEQASEEHSVNSNNFIKKENTENKGTVKNEQSHHVISSLREKIKDLEDLNKNVKCLICLEPYAKPVVSTSCWHVHCEECWLMTMGVKKLCPQCNMIVFPSDLRRIYL